MPSRPILLVFTQQIKKCVIIYLASFTIVYAVCELDNVVM